jgi:hypothetical protein
MGISLTVAFGLAAVLGAAPSAVDATAPLSLSSFLVAPIPFEGDDTFIFRLPEGEKSGMITGGLSLVFPGLGHFYLATPSALGAGLGHLIVEGVVSVAFAFNFKFGAAGETRSLLLAGWIISALLHRIACIIEGYLWGEAINDARQREGAKEKPRVALCFSCAEESAGLGMGLRLAF